jgi:hypothetical protein
MEKNKIGRPRLPENEKKDQLLRIYMSKNEKDNFKKAFKESMYTTYLKFILEKTINSENILSPAELNILRECSLETQEVIEQYKRVGNNFNQLIRLAQAEKKIPENPFLSQISEDFKALTAVTAPLMGLMNKINDKWLLK